MNIVRFGSSLAVKQSEFNFMEIRPRLESLSLEEKKIGIFDLVLNYANNKEHILISSDKRDVCEIGYYASLYLFLDKVDRGILELSYNDAVKLNELYKTYHNKIKKLSGKDKQELKSEYISKIEQYITKGKYGKGE